MFVLLVVDYRPDKVGNVLVVLFIRIPYKGCRAILGPQNGTLFRELRTLYTGSLGVSRVVLSQCRHAPQHPASESGSA